MARDAWKNVNDGWKIANKEWNRVSKYFPQLSADDVDAIADQIGELSVDEVASAIEGLFSQLEADEVDAIVDQIEVLAQTTDLTSAAVNALAHWYGQ